MEGLPLWSVIDGFSLGLLSRFITQCDRMNQDRPVWKAIAGDLDFPAQTFQTGIRSLTVLRNQVAHHSRLWMHPSTDSPRKPKRFKRQLRGADPKAMRVAFLNLAMFRPRAEQAGYAKELEVAVAENSAYFYGVNKGASPF